MPSVTPWILIGVLAAGAAAAPGAAGAQNCVDFKWDVTRERALFAKTPSVLVAGRDSASAPALALDRLYELKLAPQSRVAFAAPPGKSTYGENVYAGLASLAIAAPGVYRIAIDVPVWVDLATENQLVRAVDYEGQHDCDAPHKILVYEVTRPGRFVVQFSGEIAQQVRLTVTRLAAAADSAGR